MLDYMDDLVVIANCKIRNPLIVEEDYKLILLIGVDTPQPSSWEPILFGFRFVNATCASNRDS